MDMEQKKGRASILFEHPPVIKSVGTVSGTREGQGPLGRFFDSVEPDDKMGMENWEEAESAMQEKAAGLALKKGKLTEQEMDYSFAGDLLGQLIATSFGSGKSACAIIWPVGRLLYYGRSFRSWGNDRKCRIRKKCPCHGIQPLCNSREGIPFSSCLWKPAA